MNLEQAGLTKNESKIYLALINLGPSHAGKVAQKTGIHRRNVYDTIEILIKKGLIGYIKQNNKKLYQAANPKRILQILQEKQDLVSPLIQSLSEKFNKTQEKQETNFYKGKNGLKTIFEDQLNSKEILILGASPNADDILKFYFHWHDKKKKSKKIKTKIITTTKKIKKNSLSEIRYLPKEYESPVAVNIYEDKTAIILWASNPIAILIKNQEITKGYKKYFELIWKIAKEI